MSFFFSAHRFTFCSVIEHENEFYPSIERFFNRKSLLFRYPHITINNEEKDWKYITRFYECLNKHVDTIRRILDVKQMNEYYNIQPLYSQTFSQTQRILTQSTENLCLDSTKDQTVFMDFNPLSSKRSLDQIHVNVNIDTILVNRIQLDWSLLFNNLIIRMKRSIIYHFITSRFELQINSKSSLNDMERQALAKLQELLPPFRTDQH